MSDITVYSRIIQERRPLLGNILSEYGNLSVWDATSALLKRGQLYRQSYNSQFIDLLRLTFPHLNKDYLEKLDVCLKQNPLVSTADHQCPINHPVYINSNIQLSLFTKFFSGNKEPYVIPPVLSFSSLPLNNTAYIRGLLMASMQGEKRFTFFGSSMRHMALPMVKSLMFDESTIKHWTKANKNSFTEDDLGKIVSTLKRVSKETEINKCDSYSEQISTWNKWFWLNFFPKYRLEFLPIDLLSKTFFNNILINNPQIPLYKFLFNLPNEDKLELFNGIYGCWDLKSNGGTFLFWGISKEKRLLPLQIKDNYLVCKTDAFAPIKWVPKEIGKAWSTGKIIPSLLMNYLIMVGHYGLFCSGAFNQIGYLQPIMKAYASGLTKLRLNSEQERVDAMGINGVHAFLYFLFGATKDLAMPLCGLNMLDEISKMSKIEESLKKITMNEVFTITAPLIFPYVVAADDVNRYNFSFDKSYKQIRPYIPKELIIQSWFK